MEVITLICDKWCIPLAAEQLSDSATGSNTFLRPRYQIFQLAKSSHCSHSVHSNICACKKYSFCLRCLRRHPCRSHQRCRQGPRGCNHPDQITWSPGATGAGCRVPGGLYNNPKPQPIFQSGLPTVLLVSIPMPLFASVDRFLHTGRYFGHCYGIVDSRGIYAKKKIFPRLFKKNQRPCRSISVTTTMVAPKGARRASHER